MKSSKAFTLCLFLLAPFIHAIDDTVTIVDGVFTNIGAFVPSGTNNVLIITNGGIAGITSVASQSIARSNAVFVVGSGSMISNSSVTALNFAAGGISNALVFRDGGSIYRRLATGGTNNAVLAENTALSIGSVIAGGRSNRYILDNASLSAGVVQINTLFGEYVLRGSQWTDTDFQTSAGNSNTLVLGPGSTWASSSWEFSGRSNRFQAVGPDSLWKITNILSILNNATTSPGQALELSSAARGEILRDFDLGNSSSYNTLTIDGGGTILTIGGALNIGVGTTARSNFVAVTGGAHLQTANAAVGAGISNSVTVSGLGSSWENTQIIRLNDSSNRIDVLDGGVIMTGGFQGLGKSNLVTVGPASSLTVTGDLSVAKSVRVTGGGALQAGRFVASGSGGQLMEVMGGLRWTVISNLFFSTSGNTLVVADGSAGSAPKLDMGVFSAGVESAMSNLVMVTGANSSLFASAITMTSRWQSVFVENGARLNSGSFESKRGGALVEVSGASSTWENSGDVVTASFFTNDIIRIRSGGAASNKNATIGAAPPQTSMFRSYGMLSIDGPGSRWVTDNTLIVGLNANSNSFSISNGGECVVSNLVIGNSQRTNNSLAGPLGGSENAFVIDGPDSQLKAPGIIRLGYGSSTNLFSVSGGAKVIAGAFTAGEIPANAPPGLPVRGNIVTIIGPDSQLSVSSRLEIGGDNSLIVSNGARINVGDRAVLADRTSLRAQSQLIVTGLLQSASSDLFVEDSRVTAAEFQFGGLFRAKHAGLAGPQTIVDCGAIHISMTDPRVSDFSGQTTLDVFNSANVTTRWLTMGRNSRTNFPVLNIDGGFVSALAQDGSGLVEVDHGTVNIQRGALRADRLRVLSEDGAINARGALLVGAGASDNDGDVRAGADRGIVELRGTNRFSKLLVATAPAAIGSVVMLGGQTKVTNEITLGAGAVLQFVASRASGSPALFADGPVTLEGRLEVALASAANLQPGDAIVLLAGASIAGQFDNAVSGGRISTVDGSGSFALNISATAVTLTDFVSGIRLNGSFDTSSSVLRLTYPTSLGASVETSTNLVDWVSLQNAPAQTVGNDTQVELPINIGEVQRYFRLRR